MIRDAKIEDLKDIMLVIEDARKQLRDQGSLQWNLDNGYPDATDLINDLVANKVFVYEEKSIKGCIVMCDSDSEYESLDILDNNSPYVALHRMAVSKDATGKGIASKLLLHCIEKADGKIVRADTHPNNKGMIKVFEKVGFKCKGQIKLSYIDIYNERDIYEFKK